jgi:hypothetical protein
MTTTLYLDQKDVSDLAKGTAQAEDSKRLLRLLPGGSATVVLSSAHVLETALCGNESLRRQMEEFVDARLRPRVWLRDFQEIWRAELSRCWVQDQEMSAGEVDAFEDNPFLVPAGNSGSEFAVVVEDVVRSRSIQDVRNWKLGWPGLREMGRDVHRGQSMPDDVRRREMLPFVPNVSPAGEDLSQATRADFIAKLDFARCPSIELQYQVSCIVNANHTASVQSSEPFDYMHVTAIPYCDCVTLDRRMCDIVKQTKLGKEYQKKLARNVGEALQILEAS